jgi:hypothetical protein
MEPERIPPEEVHEKVKSGKCLLVCAYEDEQKCKLITLEGAMSLAEFKRRLPLLSRDQEIVLY